MSKRLAARRQPHDPRANRDRKGAGAVRRMVQRLRNESLEPPLSFASASTDSTISCEASPTAEPGQRRRFHEQAPLALTRALSYNVQAPGGVDPSTPSALHPQMNAHVVPRRKPRTLALEIVEALGDRIRDGRLATGAKLPTEAEIMEEFGVSRTVVREAISKLQASGLVQTRHGVGTFVVGLGEAPAFRIAPEDMATLQDVIAVLELRIGVETEAAALAATRRSAQDLAEMRSALDAFKNAIEEGLDAVASDYQFHVAIARATQNPHFVDLLGTLGTLIIPRARLEKAGPPAAERREYLGRVNAEHESVYEAIANRDPEAARAAMRTHLANSRERRRRSAASLGAAERDAAAGPAVIGTTSAAPKKA